MEILEVAAHASPQKLLWDGVLCYPTLPDLVAQFLRDLTVRKVRREITREETALRKLPKGGPESAVAVLGHSTPTEDPMEVGRKILSLRLDRGLEQHELAARIGITSSGLSRLESGDNQPRGHTSGASLGSSASVWTL